VVSLIDTAPTLLDLLGIVPPPAYEGHSMLDGRARLALFFTDYSLSLVGLRDGPRKVIHDRRSGRTRWFDLERDPGETADLSSAHPEEVRRYRDLLESWALRSR
jgi:arylsulfatase A-like enzyme